MGYLTKFSITSSKSTPRITAQQLKRNINTHMESFNPNPTIFVTSKHRATHFAKPHSLWLDEEGSDNDLETEDESNDIEEIDQDEIFGTRSVLHATTVQTYSFKLATKDLIRSISDPEHRNMSLEQLAVVSAPQITFDRKVPERLTVEFTPTVPHCGMSTFIGEFVIPSLQRCWLT